MKSFYMHPLLFDSLTRSRAGDLRDTGFFALQGLRHARVTASVQRLVLLYV